MYVPTKANKLCICVFFINRVMIHISIAEFAFLLGQSHLPIPLLSHLKAVDLLTHSYIPYFINSSGHIDNSYAAIKVSSSYNHSIRGGIPIWPYLKQHSSNIIGCKKDLKQGKQCRIQWRNKTRMASTREARCFRRSIARKALQFCICVYVYQHSDDSHQHCRILFHPWAFPTSYFSTNKPLLPKPSAPQSWYSIHSKNED